MSYNPHVDTNGNCVNCGTGQLNFDGRSTGCACSRVADAEYATEQRIIKLLDSGEFTTEVFEWFTQHIPHTEPLFESAVEDLSERLIALIKGENK